MKNLLLILISVFGIISVNAQCPAAGDITFDSQAAIDAFIIVYPNCTRIDGNVTIEESTAGDIKNFYGLQKIKEITGNLTIKNNSALPILSWLDALETIGGDLDVYNNTNLVSFEGLSGLQIIGGLEVNNNDKLINFAGGGSKSGLGVLTRIEGPLKISMNDALTSLAGLDVLNFIGNISLEGNIALKSISVLDNVTSIGMDVNISGNNSLTSLLGLHNISFIGGTLEITGNDALTSLSGLDNLIHIFGDLHIIDTHLTSLSGLENLNSILGFLSIEYNYHLTSLSGLSALTSIGGRFYLGFNNSLSSFEGLEKLTSTNGPLIIANNSTLESFLGLENLTSIGGFLSIEKNSILSDISSVQNIDPVTIEGDAGYDDLYIYKNPLLSFCSISNICDIINDGSKTTDIHDNGIACNSVTDVSTGCETIYTGDITFTSQVQIDAFYVLYQNCIEIDGSVTIEETTPGDITNFYGLQRIQKITSDLKISDNSALPILSWLDNLDTIGGNLNIKNNSALVSFEGLSGLKSVNIVDISNNPKLTDFAGTVAGHEGLVSLEYIKGGLGIENNDGLTSLLGLDNLASIGGGVTIINNVGLTTLSGLDNLTSVEENFGIKDNKVLTSLSGLNNLTSIGGLEISANYALTSLTGLDNVTLIGGHLHINNNDGLTSLSGLGSLTNIYGDLNIESNNALKDLSGLEKLTLIGGYFWITSNNSLTSLLGLEKVTSIGGCFGIDSNDNLTSLSGLDNLASIGGDLGIGFNGLLTSLSGLDKVDSINGYIYIADNDTLSDISAIQNIDPATVKSQDAGYKDLNIFGNPQLSECGMDLCPFVKYSGLTTDIHDNGNMCNDVALMRLMCTPPACIRLTSPVDGASEVKVNSNISWSASPDAAGYWMTAGTTQGGKEIFDDNLGDVTTWDPPNDFDSGATIYVTVTPYNFAGLLNNCPEESFSVEDVSTTISEFTKKSGIRLFPNPAKNTLYLKYDKTEISPSGSFKVDIYSATGQKVKSINHPVDKIDISNLSEGIYIVTIITGNSMASWKITVEK